MQTPDGASTSWGPSLQPDGVRFRIWSSGSEPIHLRVGGRDLPMPPNADGWHEWFVPGIGAGTPYRFVLADGTPVPDPAARAQRGGVHGESLVVDPQAYRWGDTGWRTRPWEETVHYELHVGTFTQEGTFRAAIERLDHLAALGITTIELMPVGEFPGQRGWGYDGVLIYAPHAAYGRPDDLRALIDAAHARGLNVMLDVVYNHFGPEGNFLPLYAADFFHRDEPTPWGSAIAYEKRPVRDFFIENALYWLDEFHFDGLRLDAIDHIRDDDSEVHILVELARRIRTRFPDRPVHLTTEDNRNITRLHERGEGGEVTLYTGEWNDDFHNVIHAIATGETEGYYSDFADRHWWKLARCLADGFAFQGETSPHGGGRHRGHPSGHLPPTVFVDFIQNHDQIGNRAFGERLVDLAERRVVETLMAMLLLSPHIPLLFMGEEWGETSPFGFFTDFHGKLAEIVREGRRKEFSAFAAFHADAASLRQLPDPNDPATFEASKIDWDSRHTPAGRRWLKLTTRLLRLRREHIVPLLAGAGGGAGSIEQAEDGIVSVCWRLNGGILHMLANLDDVVRPARAIAGQVIYSSSAEVVDALAGAAEMPPHTIIVTLEGEQQALVVSP